MRILMLGNSFTYFNDMPSMLAKLTGAEVVQHTRGGARLAEQLNPRKKNGAKTREALENEFWDYVVLQEYSSGPVTSRNSFLKNAGRLCSWIKKEGAVPVLYATWAYQKGSQAMAEMDISYEEMAERLRDVYREAAEQNDALIAEVGQKFYELADEQELYVSDGKHPSEAGSLLAAETIAAVIKADQEAKRAAVLIKDEPNLNRNDIRLRVLYMYQLLLQHTDAEHQLTTNQIRDIMEKEHGITMHRTTVPGDIEALKTAGFDVHARRARQNRYYLENSSFELPELKILIDAVESSKFITEKKSTLLVEKLLKLTSESHAAKLKRNLHASGRVRSANEKGYYIVDAINEAINAGKQISFFYTDFDSRKKQILRNDGKPYIVSPYTLIWNGDYYYLVGWNHEQEDTRTYRVDRILKTPDILRDDAHPVPENFDVARYTREVFRMYDNEEPQKVTLLCENTTMKGVLDKFGMDISVKKADSDHFRTKVMVCKSPTFYSWVFQWGGKIRIEGPKGAVKEYREMVQKALDDGGEQES